MGVFIDIYSVKHIGTEKYAKTFFELMNQYGLNIEKIGLFEPVRKPFTMNEAIQMWTLEEPGIYDITNDEMIGKYGSMLGASKGYWFSTTWWLHPTDLILNDVTVYMNKKVFDQIKHDIQALFEDLVDCFEAVYGYVTEAKAKDRQHITGTLTDRIPGIFWLNYYSPVFVNYLNQDNAFNEFPWNRIEEWNKGVFTQLSDGPFDKPLADLEKQAQKSLGVHKFNATAADYSNIPLP